MRFPKKVTGREDCFKPRAKARPLGGAKGNTKTSASGALKGGQEDKSDALRKLRYEGDGEKCAATQRLRGEKKKTC